MKEETETKPTDQEINAIMDKACLDAFREYKTNWKLIDFGGAKFTHLKKRGLINLTPERYDEIFERAKQQVKAEASNTLFKSQAESTASNIAKELLKSTDKNEITKNAARLIALKEYFDFLIENEFELTDFINA